MSEHCTTGQVIRIHFIFKRIQFMNISLRFTDFLIKRRIITLVSYFCMLIFELFRCKKEQFRFELELLFFIYKSCLIFCLLDPDLDPHIFADPDPGSQNVADPMDPDPKHWRLTRP